MDLSTIYYYSVSFIRSFKPFCRFCMCFWELLLDILLLVSTNASDTRTTLLYNWFFDYYCSLFTVMGGLRWKTNIIMTASLVPGIVFGVFFFLNLFLWGAGSSAAIPFTTLLALLFLYFGISVPLIFVGSFLGFRRMVTPHTHTHTHTHTPALSIPLFGTLTSFFIFYLTVYFVLIVAVFNFIH